MLCPPLDRQSGSAPAALVVGLMKLQEIQTNVWLQLLCLVDAVGPGTRPLLGRHGGGEHALLDFSSMLAK